MPDAKDKQNDLDAILDEIAKVETPEKTEVKTPDPAEARIAALEAELKQVRPAVDEAKKIREEMLGRELAHDMKSAVERAREAHESLADWPDDAIEGFLRKRALADRRIEEAWQQRETKPDAFDQVLKGLGKQLGEEVGKRSKERQTDRETRAAVESYVRRAQGLPPPEDPNIPPQHEVSLMNSAQLSELIAKETARQRAAR